MTVHGEYNFGNSVNGRGGVLIPVNSALNFPGIEGADAYDLSSIYFVQEFGDSSTVAFGKINMIDMVPGKRPFLGGAGIDAFWNLTFVAPPTGTVPAYLLGALSTVRTERATYRLWVYDPASYVNELSLADAFEDGVTIRGSVQWPVTIAGRRGSQGFTALYSTQDGTDLSNLDDILVPTPEPGTVATKEFALLLRLFVRPVPVPASGESRRRVRAVRTVRDFGRQSERAALDVPRRPGRHGPGARPERRHLGRRLLLRRLERFSQGCARGPSRPAGRTGPRDLLRLGAHALVPRRRRPPGDQARARRATPRSCRACVR